jgi:hypothetical protein
MMQMVTSPAGNLGWLWATIPSPLPEEPPIDPRLISPGLLGLAAFLFLIIAVALLLRSMRKQLRKVSPDLPEAPPREPTIPIVDQQASPLDQRPAGDSASARDSASEGVETPTPPTQKGIGGEPTARD